MYLSRIFIFIKCNHEKQKLTRSVKVFGNKTKPFIYLTSAKQHAIVSSQYVNCQSETHLTAVRFFQNCQIILILMCTHLRNVFDNLETQQMSVLTAMNVNLMSLIDLTTTYRHLRVIVTLATNCQNYFGKCQQTLNGCKKTV